MTIATLIQQGQRYDQVEITRNQGETLVAITSELRNAAKIIGEERAIVDCIMVVPEFDDEGEETGRTLILIDIV